MKSMIKTYSQIYEVGTQTNCLCETGVLFVLSTIKKISNYSQELAWNQATLTNLAFQSNETSNISCQ